LAYFIQFFKLLSRRKSNIISKFYQITFSEKHLPLIDQDVRRSKVLWFEKLSNKFMRDENINLLVSAGMERPVNEYSYYDY